jgi:hypothetical protein
MHVVRCSLQATMAMFRPSPPNAQGSIISAAIAAAKSYMIERWAGARAFLCGMARAVAG